MLCSCFFSYSIQLSISILPNGPQVTSNLLDQRAVSPQFKKPSSTSTTKSQARHEPKEILAQPFAYGPNSRLGSIRNPDLAQDVLNVLFDHFITDRQIIGDLTIGHPA